MKYTKRFLVLFLALCMALTSLPMDIRAAAGRSAEDTLSAELAAAKEYIDALTINNSSNDPETVVENFKTHFTWDNEKRENGKSYLFDWSYYNGVVFEGLEYVYEETKEDVYGDYVEEYMSSLISSDGTWAKCTNDSSKECAGYNSAHGADCYKTASLLLDLYERTEDSRYRTMAATLYQDLDNAAENYLLSNAGNNYRHTWESDPSPDLWLDGLYMILPFRAEYAKYIGDTEELELIVDRMQWVSDNMYNEEKGLFYHAADSASSNSGTYWLRSIGWYAAAIVDVMDSMEGENLEAMKAQLVKVVNGMKACQNSSNGMWLNNMAKGQSSTNPYETSGTALVSYAVMKAVNEGWLDESYADVAILAFEGICNEKLSSTTLKDICFKGAPGSNNSTFYDNEGKGVGPFIMLYAEVMEYVNNQAEEEIPEEPEIPEVPEVPPVEPEVPEVTVEGTTIKVENVTNLVGAAVTEADKAVIEGKSYTDFVAYDITAEITESAKAIISIPVPAEWNATEEELVGISVEDGEVKEIKGTLSGDGIYSFEVDHFSAKGVAYNAKAVEENEWVAIPSGYKYVLDVDGVDAGSGNKYIVVGSGDDIALCLNGNNISQKAVSISENAIIVDDIDTTIEFYFQSNALEYGTYLLTQNGYNTVYHKDGNMYYGSDNKGYWNFEFASNSTYRIYDVNGNRWYLNYGYVWESNQVDRFAVSSTHREVRLFKYEGLSIGEYVRLTGETDKYVKIGTEIDTVLEGISIETKDNENTVKVTADMLRWKNDQYDSSKEGTYTADVVYKDVVVGTVNVIVQNKVVTGATLEGNTPVTTKQNVEPDFSKIKLEVTYDDGTTETITVANGLVIEGYDVGEIGYTYAEILYRGDKYGEVRVTVEGNPYEGLDKATKYPEYPADGAVRINKKATHKVEEFKNTGVTHVELDVAGVSVKQGVDVVLVADISNSMAWKAGEKNTSPGAGETTKWQDLQSAAVTFVDKFLEDNDTATEKNTVSFVIFGGYDAQRNNNSSAYSGYFDATQTVYTSEDNINDAKAGINAFSIVGNDTDKYTVTKNGQSAGTPQGGTNYDYAFIETAAAIEQIKADYLETKNINYDESGREIYVVFMTDGAPDHYNQLYYKKRSNSQFDYYALYKNGNDSLKNEYFTAHALPNYETFNKRQEVNGYYIPNADLSNEEWIDWMQKDSLYAAEYVANMEKVNSISVIGFDLANGAFGNFTFSEEVLESVLTNLAGENSCEVFLTDDSVSLDGFYYELANKIKFAGTSAWVTDVVGSDFTVQMAGYSGSGNKTVILSNPPSITVTAYDLYTKAENATDTEGNDLTGSRKGTSKVMECVTFNGDGTEAYSNLSGKKNIMETDDSGTVTIDATYFDYTKTPEGIESFKWEIGNITDKEIVLGYDVYLKGALEGKAPEGIYYTNEEATLEYVDINGKYAEQIFDVPHVSWGGASTTIRFYLVNKNGEPVNHAGTVVSWANRIYVGDSIAVNINLNAEETFSAQTIEAAAHVPPEYILYDNNASYTVQPASGEILKGGITISDPSEDAKKTIYDDNGNATVQNGAQTTKVIDAEAEYYTWSIVGFGVRYDITKDKIDHPLNPDTIVIDYGKDIQVDVLANDKNDSKIIPLGWTAKLVGFVKYNKNTDVSYTQIDQGSAEYNAEYGTFSIEPKSGEVNFKLTKMLSEVQKVFCVVEIKSPDNKVHYRYSVLNIIPATSVYYETSDDAGNRLFGITTTAKANEWISAAVDGDSSADGPQDAGTIGQNLYGFDTSYENDKYLSNGLSLKADGQGIKSTKAEFSFTGTAFDLISRTGASQGAIRVDIYSDEAKTNRVKSITVLNKSERNLELYQIPVVSAELGTYGTYYVTIGVNKEYTNITYPELSRGGEFFFDAIRVYNPVSSDDPDIGLVMNAYMADGEANAERKEVRAMLIGKEEGKILTSEDGEFEGIVFVDRKYGVGEGVDLTDYTTIGPNNEVYLTGDQAIGLGISVNPDNLPTSIDIGAKSVNGKPVRLHATVYVGDEENSSVELDKEILSGTAQNFDLLDGSSIAGVLGEKTSLSIMIKNAGAGILSLTDLKIAYGNETSTVRVFANRRILEKTIQYAEGPMPVVSCDVLSAEFKRECIKRNAKVNLVVITDEAVERLEMTNNAGKDQKFHVLSVETADGKKVWTVRCKISSSGTQTYTIAGYDKGGNTGAAVTASIEVTREKARRR